MVKREMKTPIIHPPKSVFNIELKYRELCDVFGLEVKQGGSIKKQVERLQKDYEVIKKGSYYIIIKRLSKQDKLNQQYYNNIKAYVEMLMCTLFVLSTKEKVLEFDMKTLMQVLKLVNKDYNETKYGNCKFYANILLDIDDDDENNITAFFNETELMLQRIIKDALDCLKSASIIDVTEIPTFGKRVYDPKTHKVIKVIKHYMRKPDEIDALLQCERETFLEMGYENKQDLYDKGYSTRMTYRHNVAKNLNHDYYYTTYKIIINTKHIYDFMIEDEEEKKYIESVFNQLIKQKIIESKQGYLKLVSYDYKQTYIDAFIDINKDKGLRYKYKELKKLEEK